MTYSKRIYFIILAHILLILTTAGAGSWLIITHKGYIIGAILELCTLIQIAALTNRLNKFNQKIRLFFDAIEEKDNMLYLPNRNTSREQEFLNQSLNRINTLLAQAKTENQKQEHFYRALLEKVPSGVLAWDSSDKIVITNSAAQTLLESKQLASRQQVEELMHCKENLSLSQSKMQLGTQTITLLSITDIGDQLSDKESESWGKLTHVLTHEIMNTIAPIVSLSHTLSTYKDTNEKSLHALHIIKTQSERLMEFTESFRHLSYLPHPELKQFSITALLHNIETLLQSDLESREIKFTINYLPPKIEINGDENQLSQVFLNLIKNAMQALDGIPDGKININVKQISNKLTIDITDNGHGIPSEIKDKIFIPFFTTKSDGTGIGLSLCKRIIRLHNGHLSIQESHNNQTTFRIDLPIISCS